MNINIFSTYSVLACIDIMRFCFVFFCCFTGAEDQGGIPSQERRVSILSSNLAL